MRVQVYSRWSINRLNLREREMEREGWSRRGVVGKGQRGLFLPERSGWKEKVEKRGLKGEGLRAGPAQGQTHKCGEEGWREVGKGLLWRQDDAMLQPPHLLVAHPPRPTTDIDTGRASIRVLERGEWREARSRVTRLLAVCKPASRLIGGHRSDLPPPFPVKTGTGSILSLLEPRQRRRNDRLISL